MAAAYAFTATLCAHEGCFELAVSRCECCNDQPFCEDHGSSGDGDTVPAHCWQCGGWNAGE